MLAPRLIHRSMGGSSGLLGHAGSACLLCRRRGIRVGAGRGLSSSSGEAFSSGDASSSGLGESSLSGRLLGGQCQRALPRHRCATCRRIRLELLAERALSVPAGRPERQRDGPDEHPRVGVPDRRPTRQTPSVPAGNTYPSQCAGGDEHRLSSWTKASPGPTATPTTRASNGNSSEATIRTQWPSPSMEKICESPGPMDGPAIWTTGFASGSCGSSVSVPSGTGTVKVSSVSAAGVTAASSRLTPPPQAAASRTNATPNNLTERIAIATKNVGSLG